MMINSPLIGALSLLFGPSMFFFAELMPENAWEKLTVQLGALTIVGFVVIFFTKEMVATRKAGEKRSVAYEERMRAVEKSIDLLALVRFEELSANPNATITQRNWATDHADNLAKKHDIPRRR